MNSIPGRIQNGKPIINKLSWQRFSEANEGRWIDIVARKPMRSITQNRFYWLYLTIISEETGNDVDDLHELFKRKFLPTKQVLLKGRDWEYEFDKVASTTELTKAEFSDYLDRICSLTGVPLPDPEAAGFIRNH